MSRPHVIKEKDWWKEGFSAHDLVADADLYFDTSMAEKEIGVIVGFLKDVFGFSPIAALDICCGAARHVSALQKHVPYVVGLDYSFDFLKAGMERDFSDKLIRGDVYNLSIRSESFDLVTCMGNSIGYGKRGNDRVLASEASRVSKKGGYVVINATDPAYCRETLQPTAAYEYETPEGQTDSQSARGLRLPQPKRVTALHGRVFVVKVDSPARAGRFMLSGGYQKVKRRQPLLQRLIGPTRIFLIPMKKLCLDCAWGVGVN